MGRRVTPRPVAARSMLLQHKLPAESQTPGWGQDCAHEALQVTGKVKRPPFPDKGHLTRTGKELLRRSVKSPTPGVTLGKVLHLSRPWLPHLKTGDGDPDSRMTAIDMYSHCRQMCTKNLLRVRHWLPVVTRTDTACHTEPTLQRVRHTPDK